VRPELSTSWYPAGEDLLRLERGRLVAGAIQRLRRIVLREPRQEQPGAERCDERKPEDEGGRADAGRLRVRAMRDHGADEPDADGEAGEHGGE
jgi:hypothetical protein